MRPAVFNRVLFIALAVLALRSEAANAQATTRTLHLGKNGARVTATSDDTPIDTRIVTGEWFASSKDAEDDVLKQALGHVLNYLAERKPPIEWKPDVDYVRQRLVRGLTEEELRAREMQMAEAAKIIRTTVQINGYNAALEERDFTAKDEQHSIGRLRRVVLKIAITPRDLADIQEREQRFQVDNRHD